MSLLHLIIKSATQTVEDFNIEADMSWTIGQLKDKLAESYPSKPSKESQKLIYGGKLLPDHLKLSSILNHSQDQHTIHLVVPAPPKNKSQNESKEQNPAAASLHVPPSNSAFPPLNQPVLNPQGFSGLPAMSAAPIATQGDAVQQYVAMQQMYMQLMTQYMSQYNVVGSPMATYVPPAPTATVPAPQRNQRVPDPPERNEEENELLDTIYILSRAVMLFALLYYYSSLQRVLVVVTMFLVISFYVKLRRQDQEQHRQVNDENQRNADAATQPVPADVQIAGAEESAPDTTLDESATVSQQPEERSITSFISVIASIISSFFSSLIPADPVPLNVN